MSETILQSLDRLEKTAETIKSLTDRVKDLESQFQDYEKDATEAFNELKWVDELPDRLSKIDDTASPLKEKSDDLTSKLLELAQNEKSTLDTLSSDTDELEKAIGIKS